MAKRKAEYVFSDKDLINLDDLIKFITKKLIDQLLEVGYDTDGLDIQEKYKYYDNLLEKVFYEYRILTDNTFLEHPNKWFPILQKKCNIDIGILENIFEFEKEYLIFLNKNKYTDAKSKCNRRFVEVFHGL